MSRDAFSGGAAGAAQGEEELRMLWRRYTERDDAHARDRLILTYAPLVKYVAGRMRSALPPHVDEADLISYGLVGLISAVERFDPARRVKFETYAATRIKGAIIDELRALDWVPRSVRSRARQIERAIAELEAKLGRAPTDEEIAAKIGIALDELEESLTDISRSSIAALDELWSVSGEGDQVSLLDTIEDPGSVRPAEVFDEAEVKEALADAISRLPEREKLVVTLYYYEELTLREIGEVLGVTESRVSQLHTKAVLRLKSRIIGAVARA
jgi:RNA polymerase sigma factor for flagellar operon FliA